ncbi:transcription factor ICE1 [Physcomitrium patens]|uniref:ACT domain-containing protein n=1 Tax=Physcomitrium patens TaxID=3218 RepID=A0A2K1IQD2_PHYPA|nr:uncharacterized protein LOC112274024 [Physcomitrium patens]PNR31489.1 hypothetical protein PHYPA_025610 [Physcomitrium patens]|eukprot:XP_024358924.1 uncharacterized protein LOC112274024 [Physcomitrella patens]
MALGMGLPAEQCDIFDLHNYADQEYWSDLEDLEVDEEYAVTPREFEPVVPRSSKRTYGVFVNSEAVPERWQRRRIHGQFELLRAATPNSCTDDKTSILADSHEYIERLQRQIQELQCELDASSCFEDDLSCCEDDASSCEDDSSPWFTNEKRTVDSNPAPKSYSALSGICSQPMVEVGRNEKGLKIYVECNNTSGLLVDILNLLESSGMNVEQARISCQEVLFLECLGLKGETGDENDEAHSECVSRLIAEEVAASLRSLIAKKAEVTLQ